jgi:hypothetical protein
MEYESLLERGWMLLIDFDREVEWLYEQPLRLRMSTTSSRRAMCGLHGVAGWHAGVVQRQERGAS